MFDPQSNRKLILLIFVVFFNCSFLSASQSVEQKPAPAGSWVEPARFLSPAPAATAYSAAREVEQASKARPARTASTKACQASCWDWEDALLDYAIELAQDLLASYTH